MCKSILYFLLFICHICPAQNISINLNKNWQFKKQGETKWFTARVPGTIHTDLLYNNLISDPFYRDKEKNLKWIENENWEYEINFNVDKKTFAKKNIKLVFDGLDTYADVYLNNQLILQADNMFRGWTVDVKEILKRTANKLFIRFYSVQNKVDSIAKSKLPFVLPDNARVYARKAQYNFGWDFAPKLTTCGIWKNVRLEGWDEKPDKLLANKIPSINIIADKPPSRNVQLIQQPDSIGSSFYFQKDGQAVYIKGANWVPADVFLPSVTKEKYRQLLMAAKNANMNMLRVWGGGIYEDDYFYDLCDSLDIMIWQDFMFAGGMVPGDEHFFNNVREEVKYQIERLKNHRCIVLWCGNNEVDEAWHNWGWQQQFNLPGEDSVKIWQDYKRLFDDSLKKWIIEFDGTRPYVSSSPMLGWGKKESLTRGDSHYWGVWWGLEDLEIFEKKTGRFVSEYGMQSMPNMSTTKKFTNPQDRFLYSPVLKAHQKHVTGFENLKYYLRKYFIDSGKVDKLNLEDYTYLTQCLQYYSLKNIIAIHRSKYPLNMGTLLWQLNDSWPATSWSIIDYYGKPKAAWYAVKQAYRDDKLPGKDSVYPKHLQLQNVHFIIKQINKRSFTIESKVPAKYVYLYRENEELNINDQYFDLKPGEKKILQIIDRNFGKDDISKIKIKSLYDVIK